MKIGFSTNAFTEKSLSYAIKSISEIGFQGIEFVLDIPHAFLPIENSQLNFIKKNIKLNNLEVSNLNVNTVEGWYVNSNSVQKFEPSLSNNNEKLRKWRINYTKDAINMACELDCNCVSLTSGVLNNKNKQNDLKNFRKSIRDIACFAEQKNILIGIEYEPGLLVGKSDDVFPFCTEFKNIGLNFDICHAAVLEESIPKVIKKFGKKIFHTHISDCKNKKHFHLIPGFGDIDFTEMYSALKNIKYDGYLTAELYTYSDKPEFAAKTSFIHLKKLMN